MIDEGYIKFDIQWENIPLEPDAYPSNEILNARKLLFKRNWIGFDTKHQVGFGNLSEKKKESFLISGTQTGHLPNLKPQHFSYIKRYNLEKNQLNCIGETKASSESLTHAAVYECNENIQYVIHIHDDAFWSLGLNKYPTTSHKIPYGTPEMAMAMKELYHNGTFEWNTPLFMAGHQGGIIIYGKDLNLMIKSLDCAFQGLQG